MTWMIYLCRSSATGDFYLGCHDSTDLSNLTVPEADYDEAWVVTLLHSESDAADAHQTLLNTLQPTLNPRLTPSRSQRLTEEDVIAIREIAACDGDALASIVELFEVPPLAARVIATGTVYGWIPFDSPEQKKAIERNLYKLNAQESPSVAKRGRLNEKAAREIRRRVKNGETQAALAREFGVSAASICNIVAGRQWPNA